MADSELRRTHPLTVAVRTISQLGQAIAGVVVFTFAAVVGNGGFAFLGIAALILVGTGLIAGFAWLKWAYFRYGIVGDDLVITEGWLIRKQRSIPLARVQGVDVRANLASRLFGLADIMIQTAGGGEGEAEARIGSIPLSEAESLRADLIVGRRPTTAAVPADTYGAAPVVSADPAGGLSDYRGVFAGTERPEAAPLAEYRASLPRLILAALTSNGPLIAVAATVGVTGQMFEFTGSAGAETAGSLARASIPVLIILALGVLFVIGTIAIGVTVSRDFGFAVRRTPDRLETEAGLLERRMTSVPVRRIQAVIVEATWPRLLLGLQSARVNTAGFGRSEDQQSTTSSALVPIARNAEMRDVLAQLLPEAFPFPLTRQVPRRALRFYVLLPTLTAAAITLLLTAAALAILASLKVSDALAVVAPLIVTLSVITVSAVVAGVRALAWRSSGFGVEDDALAIDYGVLGRYRVRVGRSRIQSLAVSQSPFQRRAGLATLHVESVSGSAAAHFRVRHMAVEDAAGIERWYSTGLPQGALTL